MLLIIGGPTASGKTAAAIHVACLFDAHIVGADAMQVYRTLDIGTAKPPRSVLGRYPHDCVDVRDPDEEFSVADFVEAVESAQKEHERVVVVGGTPFYLSALVRPLAPLPASDPEVRRSFEGLEDPHELLKEIDPDMAARLHENDRVRVIRALEVHALTGRTLSRIQAEDTPPPASAHAVWLDSPVLDERIEARLQRMVTRGYFAEAQRALDTVGPDIKPLKSFAYKHILDHLQGQISEDEALRLTARDTRRFARKQRTWGRSLALGAASTRDDVLRAAERAYRR